MQLTPFRWRGRCSASQQWSGRKFLVGVPLWLVATIAAFATKASSQSTPYTLEVCPGAIWRDAIFLRGPSSTETFSNVTGWKRKEFNAYVQGTILPQSKANIIFILMAAVSLIVFLLWRLFRRCCMACCMRESCEKSRNEADPKEVLSGWLYWLHKSVVVLFAVAALAMMIAGLVIAPKELVVKLWEPLHSLSSYMSNTTTSMDDLVGGLGGVNPILDNLTTISNNDVNLPSVRSNLQQIGATLDQSAADPNTVGTALTALNASVTSVRSQMASLRSQLGSGLLGGNVSTLAAGMPGLGTAVPTFNNYSTLLNTLSAQLTALQAQLTIPYKSDALEAAMAHVEVSSWQAAVAAMLGTLDTWRSFRLANTLSDLAAAASALNTAASSLNATQLPSAASGLRKFSDAWNNVSIAFKSLLDRVDNIQANVAQLDTASNTVIVRLRNLYNDITARQNLQPSPASLSSDLMALTSELDLGAISTLADDLLATQTAISAVPTDTLDDARTAIGNLKTALDNLQPKKDATAAAIAVYKNNRTKANFDDLKSTATATGTTWSTATAKTSADAAANMGVIAIQVAVINGSMVAKTDSVQANMASVDTSVGATDSSISNRVPPLGPYSGITVYNTMSTPKSSDLTAVSNTVARVEKLMVTVPNEVRVQVSNVNNSFGDGVDALRRKVVGNIEKFESKNAANVKKVDVARYQAPCIILAIAAFFSVLLIVFVAINCPWGIGCTIFFLLILTILLFFLAAIFAVVLVVAQDGCYHSEHIALTEVGSSNTVETLLNYYFFGNDTTSVKAVLKQADLVDVDQVTADVVDLSEGIITDFKTVYVPRQKLQNVLTSITVFINGTLADIHKVLVMADVVNVRPLYEGLKSVPCCEVTDYSAKTWVVFTFGGWLIFIACNLAMSYLRRLDQLPHSGCCGCKPLFKSRLEGKVQHEGSDEEATKALVLSAPDQQAMAGAPYVAYVDPYTGHPMAPYPGAPPSYAGPPPPYAGPPPPYQATPVDSYTGQPLSPPPRGQ